MPPSSSRVQGEELPPGDAQRSVRFGDPPCVSGDAPVVAHGDGEMGAAGLDSVRRSAAGRGEAFAHDAGDAMETAPAKLRDHPPRRTRLVIATGNAGKLREFRALLEGLPFEVIAQSDLGVVPAEETGATFLDNALLKARHAAASTHAAALADDSGLEVDALGGAPGIYSARYAGLGADDVANNAKLQAALEGVPFAARHARYRCVLAFVAGPDDAAPLTAAGVWQGIILDAPRGSAGFGYDPYFWLPELNVTAAELEPAEKNRRSHRGVALRALRGLLAARAPS